MKKFIFLLSFSFVFLFLLFYNFKEENDFNLPIFGGKDIIKKKNKENVVEEVIYHTIDYFSFIDQFENVVNTSTFHNKVYVANFFFTTCPTICPVMTTQMLKVYNKYKNSEDFKIISHSIDPNYDSVEILKSYSENIGINDNKIWHFVTGDKNEIYKIAQESYYISVLEDKTIPGGIVHGGTFILVDKNRKIRGFYDGTKEKQVDNLIKDIYYLLSN